MTQWKLKKQRNYMQAIRDNILVKPCASESISDGGLFVPDSFKERSNKAVVVSVGDGIAKKPMYLKVGQTIFHIKGAGTEIEKDGEKFYLMKQQDVLACLKN